MPKSNVSSPSNSALSKSPVNGSGDDGGGHRLSETALRKKKNADAQAAFRQRRANYIATLEETVTSLESVVLELQDSCSAARNDISELRTENARLAQTVESLRHELRDRDKYLRALYHAKRGPDHGPRFDEFSGSQSAATAAAAAAYGAQQAGPTAAEALQGAQMAPSLSGTFGGHAMMENALRYPTADEGAASLPNNPYHDAPGSAYGDRSPSMPYMTQDGDVVSGNGQRIVKMSPYNVYMTANGRDTGTGWPAGMTPSSSTGPDGVPQEPGSQSHSPAFTGSPIATSAEITYGPRYPIVESQRPGLANIDTAPYMFTNDRANSPALSSPHTGSTTSVSSTNFNFVFPTESPERPDAEYRRHTTHGAELTLHGGTADVSSLINRRRSATGPALPERPMLGTSLSFLQNSHNNHNNTADRDRDNTEVGPSNRRRRNTAHSSTSRSSRSPSPGAAAPISSTLAVIKAQAFGALRRTRARPKKATETAAKMAMEVLEARGIGLGVSTSSGSAQKRMRLHSNTDDETKMAM